MGKNLLPILSRIEKEVMKKGRMEEFLDYLRAGYKNTTITALNWKEKVIAWYEANPVSASIVTGGGIAILGDLFSSIWSDSDKSELPDHVVTGIDELIARYELEGYTGDHDAHSVRGVPEAEYINSLEATRVGMMNVDILRRHFGSLEAAKEVFFAIHNVEPKDFVAYETLRQFR